MMEILNLMSSLVESSVKKTKIEKRNPKPDQDQPTVQVEETRVLVKIKEDNLPKKSRQETSNSLVWPSWSR